MKNRLYKRIAAWLLALTLSAGSLPCARAAETLEDYIDIKRGGWYAMGVRYCLEKGIMAGYGSDTKRFEPEAPMTRAELVTILWRLDGEPMLGLSMQYLDVPEGAWYEDAARWALSAGIMGGTSATTFVPDELITREQLALILWRYAEHCNGFVPALTDPECEKMSDFGAVSDYAVDAMQWAYALGIITGYQDIFGVDVLEPLSKPSRAAVATILMRFCLDMGLCA